MQNLGALGIGIVSLAVVLVVGFLILAQAESQIDTIEGHNGSIDPIYCATSVACNASGELTDAIATIPGWVPLIVIAVIGSLLLGLVALFRR